MKKLELSIKTTSLCQRMCRFCTVKSWMQANPHWHTSITEIEKLIKYSKEKKYHWNYILLSGGEPLLWANVIEGTKLLFESGITDRLILLTNGLEIQTKNLNKIDKIINNVHEFRISKYSDNHSQIKLALEYFGKLKNKHKANILNVVDRGEHLVSPIDPVPNSLPAKCTCRAYSMVGGKMDYCGPARSLCLTFPVFVGVRNQFSSSFISKLYDLNDIDLDEQNEIYCEFCIANQKVAVTLKKEKS